MGNPVEISKFFPPYGGKILKVFPPDPSGMGGKIVRFFPPSPSDMGGENMPILAKTPHMGGKIHPWVDPEEIPVEEISGGAVNVSFG